LRVSDTDAGSTPAASTTFFYNLLPSSNPIVSSRSLSEHAANVAWQASLEIEDADPGWPDRDARHSYDGLAHLRNVVLSALFSKVPMRGLFKFLDQPVHFGHSGLPSNQKHFRRESFSINCDCDRRVCT